MNKNITVVPVGGLCNRINTIKCAIATHDALDLDFKVCWRNNSELKAKFTDLFEPIETKGVQIIDSKNPLLWPGGGPVYGLMNLSRKIYGFDKCFNGTAHSNEDFKQLIGDANNVYIFASNRFSPFGDADTEKFFHPIMKLQKRIDKISKGFENVIGIHIRRTDNVVSILNSPDEKFFVRIDSLLENNPSQRFFLATDDNSVKNTYERRYGDHIATNRFDLSRNTLEGMENAVVDLWSLARCQRIIGSSHSTYSICAADIFKHKLEIIE
jgi:hypothetical protein